MKFNITRLAKRKIVSIINTNYNVSYTIDDITYVCIMSNNIKIEFNNSIVYYVHMELTN